MTRHSHGNGKGNRNRNRNRNRNGNRNGNSPHTEPRNHGGTAKRPWNDVSRAQATKHSSAFLPFADPHVQVAISLMTRHNNGNSHHTGRKITEGSTRPR